MKAPRRHRDLVEQSGVDLGRTPLPPPSPNARREIARHLREEHGYRDFRLERDVYLGGGKPRLPAQLITWDAIGARFWCGERACAGLVFLTGETTPEMVARTQRWDPALRPHLAGLRTQQERDEMTRRYLSGELNAEQLRRLRAAGPRHRAAKSARPTVAEAHGRVQEWMLERIAERGIFERVLDEAEEMQARDPYGWRRIAFRPYARETLKKIWVDIDPALRAQARDEASRRGGDRRKKLTRPYT